MATEVAESNFRSVEFCNGLPHPMSSIAVVNATVVGIEKAGDGRGMVNSQTVRICCVENWLTKC